jgi:hypothetical protein
MIGCQQGKVDQKKFAQSSIKNGTIFDMDTRMYIQNILK